MCRKHTVQSITHTTACNVVYSLQHCAYSQDVAISDNLLIMTSYISRNYTDGYMCTLFISIYPTIHSSTPFPDACADGATFSWGSFSRQGSATKECIRQELSVYSLWRRYAQTVVLVFITRPLAEENGCGSLDWFPAVFRHSKSQSPISVYGLVGYLFSWCEQRKEACVSLVGG